MWIGKKLGCTLCLPLLHCAFYVRVSLLDMPTSTAAISTASTNTTTTQSNVLSATPITGPLLSQKPVVLWFHDPGTYSNQDAVVNPDQFPNFRDGQLLRIHFLQQAQQQQTQQQSTPQNKSSTQKQQAAGGTNSSTSGGGGGGGGASSQQQQQSPQRPPIIVKAGLADREALTRQQHLQVCKQACFKYEYITWIQCRYPSREILPIDSIYALAWKFIWNW